MKLHNLELSTQARNKLPDKKDWVVRYYNKKDKEISSHIIKDRTEHEAENEAMADMPRKCDDWTMMEK